MDTTRRSFIKGLAATAGVCAMRGAADAADAAATMGAGAARHDPNLVAFISDLHVNGLKAEVPTHCYEEVCLRKTVADILAMRPMPANVVCLGDIAYHWGQREDYALASEILKPLSDAGIRLVLGMGNHDRRGNFLEYWPEYAKSSPVEGRIVSKLALPGLDLLLLDTLNALEVEKFQKSKPGEMDAAQREWLDAQLQSAVRPVLVCSHHRPDEDKVGLVRQLKGAKACKGHIYGHWHYWTRDIVYDGWTPQKILPIVGIPSTGHWGDIGYATMRIFGDRVEITNHQNDFFFTGGPGDDQPNRDYIVRERDGQTFTLSLL